MPENKSKFLIPAVGTAVVVVAGIVAYMYLKGPSGDGSGALGSAKIVPSQALMATYITTDPQAWAKLEQFGTPEAQKLVAKGLEEFNQDVFTGSNISYDKDLKPWVGGVMIAVLPPNAVKPAQLTQPAPSPNAPTPNVPIAATKAPEPNILMVVGIKDKISALNFAKKLKEDKSVKTKEIDYKGEKITETAGKGTPTYSTVLNNTYLVLAPQKQGVEQAIDTFKGQPSFASKEGANSILAKGVDVKNTLAQIYVPDYANMVQQLIATNPQATALPPQTLAQLKQVKSMVAGVGIDEAGVRMKAIANLDSQLSKFQYQNSPAKVVSQFPGDTIALVSGQGISKWWTTVVEQSKDYPEFKQALEQARSQLKVVNLDLDKEVFGWMDGEFGLAAIPSNQGLLAQVGFGGALVFDTSDRKTAEGTFSKLDNIAKTQSLTVAKRNIGGKDVTEWQIPLQGALVSHGWLDGDTLFLAFGGPIAEAIASPKGESLEKSQNFKTITGSLKQPNGGYFYLDMDKTMTIVNRFTAQSQPIPPEANAIFSSIRGLGVTATSPDKSTSQMEMLLALKPKTGK
jgi:Protein of unknown function (DUF3352)